MSQILFNRTVKTNIILYPTDGTGRDCYITYNNAGFWKDNIKRYSLDEKYKRSSFARFHSLKKIPPTWNYHADGTGRDSYILYDYGGLVNMYKTPNFNNFRNWENSNNSYNNRNIYLSRDEKLYKNKLTKIQKDVVNRLYYKPKQENQFKNFNLKRENSYANVFRKLKLEPLSNHKSYNDNEKNTIINDRYFYNNEGLRNKKYLNNFLNEDNNNNNVKSRNKMGNFKHYRIKCLSNNFDEKKNHYPFNQFVNKMTLTKKNSDEKINF